MPDSRADAILPRHVLLRVDVDLYESDLALCRVGGGELLEDGRNGLARAAPVCVEVGDGVGVRGGDCLEVGGGGDLGDFGHFVARVRGG